MWPSRAGVVRRGGARADGAGGAAAGLPRLTLLEEPQAAFYAWMAGASEAWAGVASQGDAIALVCDVGGGTTDFSLIRVRSIARRRAFDRVAVGDHLLLGGDNLDFALAMIVERRIAEARPDLRLAMTQRSSIRRLCSAAKERMLGEAAADRVPITVLGVGRSLIGDSMTVDLTRDEVEAALHEFLPLTRADEESRGRDRRAGLRELGLPYETDPAITRHLAAFLVRSAAVFVADHRAVAFDGRTANDPSRSRAAQWWLLHPAGRSRAGRAGAGRLVRGNTTAARDREPRGRGRHRRGDLCSPACWHRPHRVPRKGGERTRVLHRSRCTARSGSDSGRVRVLARGTEEKGRNRPSIIRSRSRRIVPSFSLTARRRAQIAPGDICFSDPPWTPGIMRRSSPYSASAEVAPRRAAGPTLGRVHGSRHAGTMVPIADDRTPLAAAVSSACGALRRR